MRVEKRTPPPAPTPPATYDIIGLSHEEVTILCAALARVSGRAEVGHPRHFLTEVLLSELRDVVGISDLGYDGNTPSLVKTGGITIERA